MIRHDYINDLKDLRAAAVAMSNMVGKAISGSVESLIRQDVRIAEDVVAAGRVVNKERWATEEDALRMIVTQVPMAGGLRNIAAAIHIVTDLKRLRDLAAGIAKIAIDTANEPLLKPLVDIPRMAEVARAMPNNAITAHIEAASDSAGRIDVQNDEVDALYEQIYHELLTYTLADPSTINRAIRLRWSVTTWTASLTEAQTSMNELCLPKRAN